jgi:hypothetical protein
MMFADAHHAASTADTGAVDPHKAGTRKFGGHRPRAHQPGVPNPFVDALTVTVGWQRATFQWCMIFSENRIPPQDQLRGASLFRIMHQI